MLHFGRHANERDCRETKSVTSLSTQTLLWERVADAHPHKEALPSFAKGEREDRTGSSAGDWQTPKGWYFYRVHVP